MRMIEEYGEEKALFGAATAGINKEIAEAYMPKRLEGERVIELIEDKRVIEQIEKEIKEITESQVNEVSQKKNLKGIN